MSKEYLLPDGARADDLGVLVLEWEKCEQFMRRLFPEHRIVSCDPGFVMCSCQDDCDGRSVVSNRIEFTTELYLHLLKNKNEIAGRLLDPA